MRTTIAVVRRTRNARFKVIISSNAPLGDLARLNIAGSGGRGDEDRETGKKSRGDKSRDGRETANGAIHFIARRPYTFHPRKAVVIYR